MNYNRVELIGRFVEDPKSRTTDAGAFVTTFTLATNRQWKSNDGTTQKETEYHKCVAWERVGNAIKLYGQKGQLAFVVGRLKTRNWLDSATGDRKYITEIDVREYINLDKSKVDDFDADAGVV